MCYDCRYKEEKLPLSLIKNHTTKTYVKVDIELQICL